MATPRSSFRAATLPRLLSYRGPRSWRSSSLAELCARLRGEDVGERRRAHRWRRRSRTPALDLADVVGQDEARHAVEVAAAGGHHLLLTGPPGVGKTMLAERLPGLLPDLEGDDALEVHVDPLAARPARPWPAAAAAATVLRAPSLGDGGVARRRRHRRSRRPARSRSRTTACCSSTRRRSSNDARSMRCASRWSPAWSRSTGPAGPRPTPHGSSSSSPRTRARARAAAVRPTRHRAAAARRSSGVPQPAVGSAPRPHRPARRA